MPQIWSEAMRNEMILERGQVAYAGLLKTFKQVVQNAQASGRISKDLNPEGTSHVMLSLVKG